MTRLDLLAQAQRGPGEGSTGPRNDDRPLTYRYAIRRDDGRWLTLGASQRVIVPLWVPEEAKAWTWPSMTAALGAVLDVGGELGAMGPWTVKGVWV